MVQLCHSNLQDSLQEGPHPARGLMPELFEAVVAGQAAHWFDMGRFAAAIRLVTTPGAVVAVWCYRTLQLDHAELDALIEHFYEVTLQGWWPVREWYGTTAGQ